MTVWMCGACSPTVSKWHSLWSAMLLSVVHMGMWVSRLSWTRVSALVCPTWELCMRLVLDKYLCLVVIPTHTNKMLYLKPFEVTLDAWRIPRKAGWVPISSPAHPHTPLTLGMPCSSPPCVCYGFQTDTCFWCYCRRVPTKANPELVAAVVFGLSPKCLWLWWAVPKLWCLMISHGDLPMPIKVLLS